MMQRIGEAPAEPVPARTVARRYTLFMMILRPMRSVAELPGVTPLRSCGVENASDAAVKLVLTDVSMNFSSGLELGLAQPPVRIA